MKIKFFYTTFLVSAMIAGTPLMSDDSVNKNSSDQREYNIFTLKNGIDVVTVSDPDLVTSAATLSVGVGAFQDPEDAHGIAHFLEHMLFMGSKKFPEPNEYICNLFKKMVEIHMPLQQLSKLHICFQSIARNLYQL